MSQTSNDTGSNSQTTVAPIREASANASQTQRPEFIRTPKIGLCPYTGLSRAKMYELITVNANTGEKPPVKSVCLRKPGAIKGTRLIHLQSLLDYLHAHAEGGQ